ncbi:MAG: enolase C-terminal domain-like protein [Candidatus Pacebacteria bacterium]|nr:enolase C-terminal domain-like protein [Candidatus Paceibacterota bacterium]
MKIDNILIKIIQDSRGEETLKAIMRSGDIEVSSSVPRGKSTGEKEVFLRDTRTAVRKFELIKERLLGIGFKDLNDFDGFLLELDGTKNKNLLGGNLILVLSQAFCRLAAKTEGIELWQYLERYLSTKGKRKPPLFFFNLINGGKHAPFGPKIQEYMIVPQVDGPKVSLETAKIFFAGLKEYFKKEFGKNKFGDEGGLLFPGEDYENPLEIFEEIRDKLNLQNKVKFALDAAASSFYDENKEKYLLLEDKAVSKKELLEIYKKLISRFEILSIEDPFEEKDFESFGELAALKALKKTKTIVIGDDLTATNFELLEQAIKMKAVNGVIIKPTQVGTVSETLKTINLATENKIKIIVSHRSAETDDDFIADLAWASNAWGLKAGAPQPEERMVKYNRIIQISNAKS